MNNRLSIITVVKNNLQGLKRTFESIETFSSKSVEWIVVDGNSNDNTVQFLNSILIDNFQFISESDRGMYDAMNKGILLSKGEYLLFLNAGDLIREPLDKVLERLDGSDLIFFNIEKVDRNLNRVAWKLPSGFLGELKSKPIIPHQSTLIKREIFDKYGLYDTSYRYLGDYDFFSRILTDASYISTRFFLDLSISVFVLDGVTADWRSSIKILREIVRVQKKYFNSIDFSTYILHISKYLISFLLPSSYLAYIRRFI